MADEFARRLNDLLVSTFRSILKAEEQVLQATGSHDLSVSEVHLIESVGKGYPFVPKQNPVIAEELIARLTIKDIADDLGITTPSVTIGVNKLVQKGYLVKLRAPEDGRKVYVGLTDKGLRVNRLHQRFHDTMINRISRAFTPEEKEVLVRGVDKLNSFFSNLSGGEEAREL